MPTHLDRTLVKASAIASLLVALIVSPYTPSLCAQFGPTPPTPGGGGFGPSRPGGGNFGPSRPGGGIRPSRPGGGIGATRPNISGGGVAGSRPNSFTGVAGSRPNSFTGVAGSRPNSFSGVSGSRPNSFSGQPNTIRGGSSTFGGMSIIGGSAGQPHVPHAPPSPWRFQNPVSGSSSLRVRYGAPVPVPAVPIRGVTLGTDWKKAHNLIRSGNVNAANKIIQQQLNGKPSLGGMMSTYSSFRGVNLPDGTMRALQNKTLAEARMQIRQGTNNTLPYVALAQISLDNNNPREFREATRTLVKRFPDSEYSHFYTGVQQIQDGDYQAAEASLRRARAMGMPEESVAELLRIAIDNQRWIWQYAQLVGVIIVLWLVGLGLLFVTGWVLSSLTLRSVRQARLEVQSAGERWLRAVYRAVINLASFYYYLSLPMVLLVSVALPLAMGYALLMVPYLNLWLVGLVLLLGLGSIITAVSGIRAAFVRVKGGPECYRTVTDDEWPEVWNVAHEVAQRVGTRSVDEIRIVPDTDLSVREEGRFFQRLRDRGHRVLFLGLGVLQGMKLDSFKAILAHEYGHFQNRDTAGGGLALQVQIAMAVFQDAIDNRRKIRWWDLTIHFLRLYQFMFRRLTLGASRLQEVLADRLAVLHYGCSAFREGLTHVIRRSVEFNFALNKAVNSALQKPGTTHGFYDVGVLPKLEEREGIEAAVRAELDRATDADDTHPSPKDRFALNERLDFADYPVSSQTAWSLLPKNDVIVSEASRLLDDAIGEKAGFLLQIQRFIIRKLSSQWKRYRDPDALVQRAQLYMEQGNFAKAIEDFSRILHNHAHEPDVLFYRAMAYKELKYWGHAAEDLHDTLEAIRGRRSKSREQKFVLYAHLGECLLKQGYHTDAIDAYNAALRRAPESLVALVERGQAYFALGQYTEAEQDFTTAVSHWPNSPEPYLERAKVHDALGRPDLAAQDREAARQHDFRLSEILKPPQVFPTSEPRVQPPSLPAGDEVSIPRLHEWTPEEEEA